MEKPQSSELVTVKIDNITFDMSGYYGDYITNVIKRYNCWEPFITRHFSDLIKSDPSLKFGDIGACFGYYSLIHQCFSSAACIAVEPNPVTHEILKYNMQSHNNVTLYLNAIGYPGPVDLGFNPQNIGGARRSITNNKFYTTKLPLLDIADGLNVLKIDVEGSELEVLNSGIPDSVKYIYLELSPAICGYHDCQEIIKLLTSASFELFDLRCIEQGVLPEHAPMTRFSLDQLHTISIQTNIFAKRC